jgi:hypothetical protein
MKIFVGLENNFNGRSLAWALDYPGCFSYGNDATEAVVGIPRALIEYQKRIEKNTDKPWLDLGDFDVRLVELFEDYHINVMYEWAEEGKLIQSWYRHDWKPLTRQDIEHIGLLLKWSRSEILEILNPLSEEQLAFQPEGERWSIQGIAAHVGTTEWWLLDRIGMASIPRASLVPDVKERMQQTRTVVEKALPELAGLEQVVGKEGEFWSPRKVMRRLLWHEMDHIQHIQKLLSQM